MRTQTAPELSSGAVRSFKPCRLVADDRIDHLIKQVSAFSNDVRRRAFLGQWDDAFMLVVDLERTGLQANANAILFGRVGWYSPRVPAGETSAILEVTGLDFLAVRVGDGELGARRAAAIDIDTATPLAAQPDQRHSEGSG